ncbi:protein of unknown function [Epibacterium ulvae]|uniref:DUF4268 domain-containing protein n=1 Tax=Epibacterium ulvae TaxID=1156985 RepID=A0A1G5PX61_9RHOB|nr:DUF4268 domain-containing protein [Epibacterium ulvae]SCZ53826.1 protein of unknown function [Epibacterium ulvae]
MFQVDRPKNKLRRLEERKFSDLQLREREHLQEWLADMPEALGEELLVIQKEFDGFADTRERLDLLALDKDGQLVVIENKLDDSGRDVVWQAIKYAAYCSNLKKAEIIEIFQQYLDRYCDGGNASALICEFLDEVELDSVVLNPGNQQRVMFIAANFRKEVTSTVMWLLGHGIRAQCFRVVPYTFSEELFVDLQQIIPTPEAADFMIGMASKETEEKSAQGAQRRSHKLRLEFWERALDALREQGLSRYQNISPTKDHWLSSGTGVSGCVYSLIFGKDEARVELSLQRSSKVENKWIYDQLVSAQSAIDAAFGAEMDWRRMDDKKSSRIQFAKSFDGFNRESWPEMIRWLGVHIEKLEAAFAPPLSELNNRLKSGEAGK